MVRYSESLKTQYAYAKTGTADIFVTIYQVYCLFLTMNMSPFTETHVYGNSNHYKAAESSFLFLLLLFMVSHLRYVYTYIQA